MPDYRVENVAALIEKYGALQNPWEVVHLLEFLQREPPELIIEVGVWRGGNAAILKTYFPDARYIGVDVLAPDNDTAQEFGLEMVYGDSPTMVEAVRAKIGDQKADYLFIDAAHDTDSVRKDWLAWSPVSKIVGFHDVHNPMVLTVWLEVCNFMGEHARPAAIFKEFDGHGIGLVRT